RTFFRTNHGAHRSINFGIDRSRGSVVTILNSDDLFHPARLEHLARPIFSGKTEFTMSLVEFIDGDANVLPATDKRCSWYLPKTGMRYNAPSPSLALFLHPLQVTSGNLFFTRKLFDRLGGFRNYDWAHDYDFALRATLLTEPILVSRKLIRYRYHGTNTISSIERERARFRRELGRIVEDHLEAGALAYENKTLINRFAATPYTWPHEFRYLFTARGPTYTDLTFQAELSLCNEAILGRSRSTKKDIEVSQKLWPFLTAGNEASKALVGFPGVVNLHVENLRHLSVPKMKSFARPLIREVKFESRGIGSLIETEAKIEPLYNPRLLVAGVFQRNRLIAVLRQSKSRGSVHSFRGFSTLDSVELKSKDLQICWLDFDGKNMVCRWPGRKPPMRTVPKLTKTVNADGYIDEVSRGQGYAAVEGWALIDGELPQKIELFSGGRRLPLTPILRHRADLVRFLRDSRDHLFAGFRFVMLGDDVEWFRPDIEVIAHYRGKSLRIRQQTKMMSKQI
ncbi:MAG: glycosyltransferase, partial [Bdellovibrionota bacterium]